MATVYRCDRCKTIFEENALTDIVLPASGARTNESNVLVEAVDARTVGICQDCLSKLRAFVEGA